MRDEALSVEKKITILTAKDNRKIYTNVWLPDGEIKHVMVISHGMAEHIERYDYFAKACNQQGIAVLGANHRGHGKEAQIQMHFADENGWQLVLDDLDKIINYAYHTHNKKAILFGHSMGSFVARHYAVQNGKKLSALILCGSNHQHKLLFNVGRTLARFEKWRVGGRTYSPFLEKLTFGNFNKRIKPLRTDQDWLTRDEAIVDANLVDPYCGQTPTVQFWVDFLTGLSEISTSEAFKKIPSNLPVYVISGEEDPVSRYGAGLESLVKALRRGGIRHVDFKLYPGARHELYNELNKDEVCSDLCLWLESVV